MTATARAASSRTTTMLVVREPTQLELQLPMREWPEPSRPVRNPPEDIARVMRRWQATEIFDEYWRFAVRRQTILMRRLAGQPAPWTSDPILQHHRFTNPYRFTDRVSQYLVRNVQYGQPRPRAATVFRTLLFKVFNRIDTWAALVAEGGEPTIETYDPHRYARVLGRLRAAGRKIYSPAYIVPNPPFGATAKHENHLRMLATMLDDGTITTLAAAQSLPGLYDLLRCVPSLGPFLAFQYAVDINYSDVTESGEDGFVVAGPGARAGLRKCFASLPAGREEEAILWTARTQQAHLGRLGLRFDTVAGRPLQPIDCQNLFCEIDKYTRVSHPHVAARAGRTRIKQGFTPADRQPLPPIFIPPKWRDADCSARLPVR